MLTWKRLLAPPVFEGDEEKTQKANLLNTVLLIVLLGAAVFGVSLLLFGQLIRPEVLIILLVMSLTSLGLLFSLRRGYVRFAAVTLSLVIWLAFAVPMFLFGGLHDSALTGLFVALVMAAVLTGGATLLVLGLLGGLSVLAVFLAENWGLIKPEVPVPSAVDDLVLVLLMLAVAGLLLRFALVQLSRAYASARQNAQALEASNAELQESQQALVAQAQQLERRARYLDATAAVSRQAALTLGDVGELLQGAVDLITDRLGFYHTAIFWIDSTGQWAVLQAASSEAGKRMLARGHRLRVGAETLVGRAAARRTLASASDLGQEPLPFENPDLRETRSEVALPLQVGSDLIGVLDVQSTEAAAFGEEDLSVLETMADQVALAIHSARLFYEVEQRLESERRAYGELSAAAWRDLLRSQADLGYISTQGAVQPAGDVWRPEMKTALETGQVTSAEDDPGRLAIPIQVRGQVIGVVDGRKPQGAGPWNPEEIGVLQTLTEQLNLALEGARLYRDSKRLAAREQVVGQIATNIRASLDMDTVLKTAVSQMREALGLHDVTIRLGETGESEPSLQQEGLPS